MAHLAQGCLAQFTAGGGKGSVGKTDMPPVNPQLFGLSRSHLVPVLRTHSLALVFQNADELPAFC